MQTDIFNVLYEKYKIIKPIRLIELFGGYGSQHFALEYLGANFEHWKLVEWAVKSIQAYKDAHYGNDNTDYSKELSKDELIDYLYNKHISMDYNKPMKLDQIKRKDETWLRTVYNNIQATKNIVDIQNTKGSDLEIVDTDKYDYIMTYSFPCQDLSLAGKRLGMSDTSTRSGMLWEVERILDECKELPQILLMENVPQVIGKDNVEHFNKWQTKLEQLGYKNYHQNLIATDYGIPQTRNRTFMVSILGNYSYTFPNPIPLKLKLKDMLEDNVDERYYLSDKQLKDIANWNAYEKPLEHIDDEIVGTLTTRSGAYCAGMKLVSDKQTHKFLLTKNTKNYIEWQEKGKLDIACRAWKDEKVVSTLHTKAGEIKILENSIAIPEATKKGYAEARAGDGIYINRPHQKRGCVQKEKIQTLKTTVDDIGVVVNHGIATNESKEWQKKPLEEKSRTILANKANGGVGVIENNLRIRKLTPKECFRLMGVKDEDYERIAKNQSDSSLYHLAGDGIVINVLMAIFKELI